MDCTSKAIRNTLTPLRSLFEDALNDEIIDFNPFERIALSKLIRQTAKASDYVVSPFSSTERAALLDACRSDERPMLQFWFSTGLRPGELQALGWRHINWERRVARTRYDTPTPLPCSRMGTTLGTSLPSSDMRMWRWFFAPTAGSSGRTTRSPSRNCAWWEHVDPCDFGANFRTHSTPLGKKKPPHPGVSRVWRCLEWWRTVAVRKNGCLD